MDYLVKDSTLTGIADAIRNKGGLSNAIAVGSMADAITSMQTETVVCLEKTLTWDSKIAEDRTIFTSEEILTATNGKTIGECTGFTALGILTSDSTAQTYQIMVSVNTGENFRYSSSAAYKCIYYFHSSSASSGSIARSAGTSLTQGIIYVPNSDNITIKSAVSYYWVGTYHFRLYIIL